MSSQQVSLPPGPERQRVLNVLAQRRYRERKRERLQAMEQRFRASSTDAAHQQPQVQHLEPSLLPSPCMASAPNNSLHHRHQELDNEVAYDHCMRQAPYEMMCTTFGNTSMQTGDHFGIDTMLSCGDIAQNATTMTDAQLSTELQQLEASQFTFPSEYVIDIPTLKTMEASLRIASMLGIVDDFLDLTASRVLDVSKMPVTSGEIPENLRPTQAQLSIPHCPGLDVLPFPSVRTKLICLFNQPDQLRPPIARGSMAIMRLLHSFDDESEGLRLTLENNGISYDTRNWEIGQAIFENWWWVLDSEIVSNSNRLRQIRGAPELHFPVP